MSDWKIVRLPISTIDVGRWTIDDGRSVPVILNNPFLRYAPYLVERAIGTPGFRVEAGRAGHWKHITMRAEVEGVAVFRRFAPAAAVVALDGRGLDRSFDRRLDRRLNCAGSGAW